MPDSYFRLSVSPLRDLGICEAGTVASFSFLSPVFAVVLGWWLLRETITVTVWIALMLVAGGHCPDQLVLGCLFLQVPQNVAGTTSVGRGGRVRS
ncbi:MAG: EamA family transporter [Rhodobacteraceae bacterium]|nr:EamA family transporter [Paracoccaceae bacterium]